MKKLSSSTVLPGLALVLAALLAPPGAALAADTRMAAPRAPANCVAATGASDATGGAEPAYLLVPMRRVAERVSSDPLGLWTDWEMWNPYQPRGTDIWTGVVPACEGGRYLVTQFVNRQCSSEAVCPGRVIHENARGERRTLIGFKQICMTHATFRLRRDGGQLMACDHPFEWN